jgi:hypothetical protein
MLAITYDSSIQNAISLYRDGVLYQQHDKVGGARTYATNATVVIGPRVGTEGYMNGYVNEARLYTGALGPSAVRRLKKEGPVLNSLFLIVR